MIDKDEIDEKSEEFEIGTSNVQRDYVFGWLLFAIYNNTYLSNLLILKGGNCFRKAYFPNTRFSGDLDFSTEQALDLPRFVEEMEACCRLAQDVSGIEFNTERNSFQEANRANQGRNTDRKIYKGKVFFKNFYGERSSLEISVRMDVTEFDRLYMPTSRVPLIHPYTDAEKCQVELTCVALEECIASKMKCLLQRRHSHDLYDLVYAAFFNKEIDVDRSEIARVFLKKTIFRRSPGSARQILLGLPMPFFKAAWNRYIVCPIQSRLEFDRAEGIYTSFIDSIFEATGMAHLVSDAFFPAELRNVFLEAGSGMRLMRIEYDGYQRIVEPYALTYKRRSSDDEAREYLYVWDRSGGSSATPGIRSLVNPKVMNPEILDETFEPRYEVELSKAGEETPKSYFGGGRRRSSSARLGRTAPRRSSYSGGRKQVVQCTFCGKQFKRQSSSTTLRRHKDRAGYDCPGRNGYLVGWVY
ncbi:MAG: nucleotidyl transferase AbiEii/AbiGii toxin family protein [Rhodospirillaceae bacterium]|nr:nucleotidyl transferase AbiEii/AbiGii toxin family protein [Rhodospirillaceae bacterium]